MTVTLRMNSHFKLYHQLNNNDFKNCVTELWEAGMRIGTISTDRSLDMKTLIESK
jgi:hypothetical protein